MRQNLKAAGTQAAESQVVHDPGSRPEVVPRLAASDGLGAMGQWPRQTFRARAPRSCL